MNPNVVELALSSGNVSLRMITEPQLLMFTGSGAMKSFNAAVNESDERLFRYADPKESQESGSKTRARSMDASPNVRGLNGPRPSE